jgi:serine/threonine protein kinase
MEELLPHPNLSHYRIVSKIGAGGMGEFIWTRTQGWIARSALKVLPSEVAANQDRMRRFVQKAKAAASLNYPNIAHINEIGEDESKSLTSCFLSKLSCVQIVRMDLRSDAFAKAMPPDVRRRLRPAGCAGITTWAMPLVRALPLRAMRLPRASTLVS